MSHPVTRNQILSDHSQLAIVCYGFGFSPYFFDRLQRVFDAMNPGAKWEMLLPSGHHEAFVVEKTNFKLVHNLARLADAQRSSSYSGDKVLTGPLVEDLDVEKRPISNRRRREETAIILDSAIREFFATREPGVLLFPQPAETSEGRSLIRVAREMGWRVLVPIHTRYFDRTYFSDYHSERPIPDSGRTALTNEEETFLSNFRLRSISANPLYGGQNYEPEVSLPISRKHSAIRFFQRVKYDRSGLSRASLRVSLFTTWMPIMWRVIQKVRAQFARNLYDLSIEELSEDSFIFYPLQYTPESSINMHAPFFVDQLRAIDLLRQSLPEGVSLVVKEHPAALGVRKLSFIRAVRERVGVRVVPVATDSFSLIRKACLTVSVTGTAALEAKLLGHKSATLAPTFFSSFVPVIDLTTAGREKVQHLIDQVDSYNADRLVASVFDGTYDFVAGAPEMNSTVLSNENVTKFAKALVEVLGS
jgi:hypothetical protein